MTKTNLKLVVKTLIFTFLFLNINLSSKAISNSNNLPPVEFSDLILGLIICGVIAILILIWIIWIIKKYIRLFLKNKKKEALPIKINENLKQEEIKEVNFDNKIKLEKENAVLKENLLHNNQLREDLQKQIISFQSKINENNSLKRQIVALQAKLFSISDANNKVQDSEEKFYEIQKLLKDRDDEIIQLRIELRKSLEKIENNTKTNYSNYNKQTDSILISLVCDEHFRLKNKVFKDKFENLTFEISNYDEVSQINAKPFLAISTTGKFIGINLPEISSLYFVFYSKGTNITSDNNAVRAVFDFNFEPEKNKIYSNWKVSIPAILSKKPDKTWSMEEKGQILLGNYE